MNKILISSVAALALVLAGCGSDSSEVSSSAQQEAKQAPRLVLSHIACENGVVNAHFVLLFWGDTTPGDLSGTYNGGVPFGPETPGKDTGNVWHYNVTFPEGQVDIESATIANTDLALHNPGEYAGTYTCAVPPPPACEIDVTEGATCYDRPLGSPENECGAFGLVGSTEKLEVVGKDTPTTGGTSFVATMDADLVLVKSGTGGCGRGKQAYNIILGVSAGEKVTSPSWQDISHVTYCRCPTP